jgi:hypothetical protein
MAIAPRGSQLKLFYDPTFTAQSAINVPNNVNTLTAVLQVTVRRHLEPIQTTDPVYSCDGQFKISEAILTRLARLTVEFDCTIGVLKGFMRNAFGAGSGVDLTMLGVNAFQQPFLTFALGFDNAVDVGVMFHSAVVNRIKVTARAKERLKVEMELIGSGALAAATGLAFAACSEVVPLYSNAGALTINSVDRMQANSATANTATEEISLEYSNNLLMSDDPFQLASIDPTRLERADRRTILYNWKVEGIVGDAAHVASLTNPRTIWPVVWRVGATGAAGIVFTSTQNILSSDGQVQTFENEAGRACLNLKLEPTPDAGALPIAGVAGA